MKLVNNIILFGIFTLSSTALGLEFDYGKEKTYKRPVRKISIIVDERSYYPENIIAFAGEEVQFFIT